MGRIGRRRGDESAPFAGRVAIVTGGASGIGRELCRALAARGVTVIVADIDGSGAGRVADEISGRPHSAELDVTDDAAVGALVDRTAADHGRVDFMFNNAGISVAADARDYELDDWRRILDVNLWGVVHGSRHALRVMAEQGTGHIVNTASAAGLLPLPTNVPYAASKHAVVGLSRSLRAEGAALGVRVSAVCPGFVETAILESRMLNVDRERVREAMRVKPMAAAGAAEEILRGVVRNRAIIAFPGYVRLALALDRFFPPLLRLLERRMIRDFRRTRGVAAG